MQAAAHYVRDKRLVMSVISRFSHMLATDLIPSNVTTHALVQCGCLMCPTMPRFDDDHNVISTSLPQLRAADGSFLTSQLRTADDTFMLQVKLHYPAPKSTPFADSQHR